METLKALWGLCTGNTRIVLVSNVNQASAAALDASQSAPPPYSANDPVAPAYGAARADVKDPVLYGLPLDNVQAVARGCVSTSSALLHEKAVAQEKAYGIKATLSPTQAMNELDGWARIKLYDAGLHAYIVSLWHDGMSIQGNARKVCKACFSGAPITLSETSEFIRANSGVTPIWHIMAENNGQLLVTDTPLPACWKDRQVDGKWTTFYISSTKLGPDDFKPLPPL